MPTSKPASQAAYYGKTFGDYLHYIRNVVYKESLRAFAKRVELSPGYLGRLEQGVIGVPRRETVVQIAERLGQVPDIWLTKAGYAPEGDAKDTDFEYIVLKLKRLSDGQIDILVTFIDGLVAQNERKERG